MSEASITQTNAPFGGAFTNRRVFVTGHTGFKGAWLCEWLLAMGAHVTGFSHKVSPDRNLFEDLALEGRMKHLIGDVRDEAAVFSALEAEKPDFVFHLAAQALVRYSYDNPVETMGSNVMGTVHVLEALRRLDRPVSCVIVTSDKCYENREVLNGYREDDPLGGRDPYSASKGAAEIAVGSYQRSYFLDPECAVRVASGRAGNVIGGGDWSDDRIVPDCIRSLEAGQVISVRNPLATRPWQHVLEALSGYLWLAALMFGARKTQRVQAPLDACDRFNFGPYQSANVNVQALVEEVLKIWPGRWEAQSDEAAKAEAGLLSLSTDKAFHMLEWNPTLDFAQSVEMTVGWFQNVLINGSDAQDQTIRDINRYIAAAREKSASWAE